MVQFHKKKKKQLNNTVLSDAFWEKYWKMAQKILEKEEREEKKKKKKLNTYTETSLEILLQK